MNRFFNMDNKFFVFMGRVADLLLLNFLCILCCIPVVTAGASITALYYVTLKMARDEESYIARSFFRSFKLRRIHEKNDHRKHDRPHEFLKRYGFLKKRQIISGAYIRS